MSSEQLTPHQYDQDAASESRRTISSAETQGTHVFDSLIQESQTQIRRIEGDEKIIIPLVAETFSVEKQEITTGVVRIHKTVTEHEETIDTPTYRETVQVERVPHGEWVDTIPQVRYEGDTMIIPVVEEVIVVEKRLRLREELRVTKQRIEDHTPQTVLLRREEVTIDRETPAKPLSS